MGKPAPARRGAPRHAAGGTGWRGRVRLGRGAGGAAPARLLAGRATAPLIFSTPRGRRAAKGSADHAACGGARLVDGGVAALRRRGLLGGVGHRLGLGTATSLRTLFTAARPYLTRASRSGRPTRGILAGVRDHQVRTLSRARFSAIRREDPAAAHLHQAAAAPPLRALFMAAARRPRPSNGRSSISGPLSDHGWPAELGAGVRPASASADRQPAGVGRSRCRLSDRRRRRGAGEQGGGRGRRSVIAIPLPPGCATDL